MLSGPLVRAGGGRYQILAPPGEKKRGGTVIKSWSPPGSKEARKHDMLKRKKNSNSCTHYHARIARSTLADIRKANRHMALTVMIEF